jgi:hypothetical protein
VMLLEFHTQVVGVAIRSEGGRDDQEKTRIGQGPSPLANRRNRELVVNFRCFKDSIWTPLEAL